MAEPLIVETPSADLARALIQRLQAFPTELGDDGGCDVCITLTGNPDRAVTDILHAVDEWLLEHHVGRVRVRVENRMYTLNEPQRR